MTRQITLQQAEDLISRYINAGGTTYQIREGVLGLGTVILTGCAHLKEFVIEEFYINAWASGHRLKTYTKGLPAKYRKYIY